MSAARPSRPGARPRVEHVAVTLWLAVGVALALVAADFRVPDSASWGDLGLLALAMVLPLAFVEGVRRSVRRLLAALG